MLMEINLIPTIGKKNYCQLNKNFCVNLFKFTNMRNAI
jgi:hypothetical protein